MNIGERIRQKRMEAGLTLKELAEKIDVQDATVQRYERGTIKTIKPETIEEIAKLFKVSPAWLMGWEESDNSLKAAFGPKIPIIPVVQNIFPESNLLAEDNIISFAPAEVLNNDGYFYYIVKDESMIGAGIEKGSTVLVHQQRSAADGQIIACTIDGGVGSLKRFKQTGDTVILSSECSAGEPIILKISDFTSSHVTIIGVAVLCTVSKKL